jgi:flagellar motility protein MotE (MotC chaperone)
MKNVIILVLGAVLLFSASAALSLYLNKPGEEKKKEDDSQARVLPRPADKEKAPPEQSYPKNAPSPVAREPLNPVIPPPSAGITVEEGAQLLRQLREKSEALEVREKEVRRSERDVRILLDDLRSERAVIDGLRKQVTDELKLAIDRLAEAERKSADLLAEKQALERRVAQLEKRETGIEFVEKKNVTKSASWLDNMEASSAAAVLKQMADSGQMDTAVKHLVMMKERKAAEVLSRIDDPALAAQLLDRTRLLRTPRPAGVAAQN